MNQLWILSGESIRRDPAKASPQLSTRMRLKMALADFSRGEFGTEWVGSLQDAATG